MGSKMWILLLIIFAILIIICIRFVFKKVVIGKCTSRALLTNKTVLITGADKGIGYETALELAGRKARIIMACRDMINARKAAEQIKNETGNPQVFVRKIDVSNLSCVYEFAMKFLKEEKDLHILINNAGMPNDYIIKKSSPSRIINVSSLAHKFASVDVSNMNSEKFYKSTTIYAVSKLLQVLFTMELSRQLEGSGVTANCLHPGTVDTNFMKKFPEPIRSIAGIFKFFVCRTPKEGAQTSIHLAVSEGLNGVSGRYFSECRESLPSQQARDPDLAKKIFEASEKYCAKYLEPSMKL